MRKEIACVILILLAACVNKPGQPVQEATSTAVIGGADSMTSIVVADTCASFQDTVTYELRQCQLWYTKDLPEEYNGETRLWTEYEVYTENVPVINVFVSNPTDIPLEFDGICVSICGKMINGVRRSKGIPPIRLYGIVMRL